MVPMFSEPVAEDRKIDCPEQGRQAIPPYEEVDDAIDDLKDDLEQATMKDKTIVLTGHIHPPNAMA